MEEDIVSVVSAIGVFVMWLTVANIVAYTLLVYTNNVRLAGGIGLYTYLCGYFIVWTTKINVEANMEDDNDEND